MGIATVSAVIAIAEIAFPSRAWFEQLVNAMNANRARQEQLGYVDCVAQFTVLDGAPDGGAMSYRVRFEEFSAFDVTELRGDSIDGVDFALEGTCDTWRAMIESIEAGGGRPALDQTLNKLSHMGAPLKLRASDPIHADYYFRFNQSLQEFVNACAQFRTRFRD